MPRQPRQLAGIGASDLPDLAACKSHIGAPREVIADGQTLRVHDGVTPGGIPMATRKTPSMNRDPTPADIPKGEWTPWTNTVTGKSSIWQNVNGQVFDMINGKEFV